MSDKETFKTGETVETSAAYVDEWGIVKLLKKGAKFPKDPAMGETVWTLAHYPYANQVTSKNIPEEFRN